MLYVARFVSWDPHEFQTSNYVLVDVVCAGGKKLHPCLYDFDVSNTNTNHSISSPLYHLDLHLDLDLDLDLDLFIFGNRIY